MRNILLFIVFAQLLCYSQFAGGNGTEDDPWLIRTSSNLDSIRYYEGISSWQYIYFKQIADIDLGVPPWNTDQGWLPIGTENNKYSYVKYNGDGYKIKNLFINRPNTDYIGLFGNVYDIEISNVTLNDVDITGGNFTGAFAGFSEVEYNNLYEGIVTKSSVSGSVKGASGVGGFIGCANLSTVMESYNTANISGEDKVGGIIGECRSWSIYEDNYLSDVYSTGRVTAAGPDKGGIVGSGSDFVDAWSCYWDMESSMIDSSACDSKGRTTDEMTYEYSDDTYLYWDFDDIWAEDLDSLNNGYPIFKYQIDKECPSAPTNFSAVDSEPGGMVINISWNNPDTLINGEPLNDLTKVYLYRDFDLLQIYDQPQIGGSLSFTDTVLVYGFYTYKVIAENHAGKGLCSRNWTGIDGLFGGGNGTESDPYVVITANHLYNVKNYIDIENIYFRQTGSIFLSAWPWNAGKGWIPIGTEDKPFRGSYQGGLIYGLTINDPSLDHAGLFGVVENADLDSFKFDIVNITGDADCGALAGSAVSSTISKCSIYRGSITGTERIGGLIGTSLNNEISTSNSNVSVTGTKIVGGFSGYSSSAIKDCYSQGTVKGDSLIAGFVAVTSDSTITNCYSSGLVTGDVSTGGFSAQGSSDLIKGCYWDFERSTQNSSSGGEGRTTMEMFEKSTYVNWDFEDLWRLEYDYPIFVWQVSVGIEEDESTIPVSMLLYQNYPNPFNPVTDIRFDLKDKSEIRLSVFNSKGELVKTLFEGTKDKGMHTVRFDASGLNSGLYFYRLTSGNKSETKKMMLLK